MPNGFSYMPQKDFYGRNTGKYLVGSNGEKIGEEINYRKVGDRATNMVSSIRYGMSKNEAYILGEELIYMYYSKGNIERILENGLLAVKYTYDGINRLIREDNAKLGATYLFTYDNNGNILSKRTAAYSIGVSTEEITTFEDTKVYHYNGDKLMACNDEEFITKALIMSRDFDGGGCCEEFKRVINRYFTTQI